MEISEARLVRYRVLHNMDAILHDLDTEDVVDLLFADGVLTDDDIECIAAEKTRQSRVRTLIEQVLERHGECAYINFIHALRRSNTYPWLVEQIEATTVRADNEYLRRDQDQFMISALSDILATNSVIVRGWQVLARDWGISNVQIDAIRKEFSVAEPYRLMEMLLGRFWRNLELQTRAAVTKRHTAGLDSNGNSVIDNNSQISSASNADDSDHLNCHTKLRLLLRSLEKHDFNYAARQVRQRFTMNS